MRPPTDRRLLLLLAGSVLLRLILAWQGGQLFINDERRYERGVILYQALVRGDGAALADVLRWPEHAAFNYVNTAVAALHHGLAQFTGRGEWARPTHAFATAWIAAALLSLASVAVIWLVHRIALAAGAGADEAFWASLLAAASNTLFYYSRHLQPYDLALAAGLAGLLAVLKGRALLAGAAAALSFELYQGYWFLSPLVLVALGLTAPDRGAVLRQGLRWAAGFVLAIAIVTLPGTLLDGGFFWGTLLAFSGTVVQGSFAEGWSLPGAYLARSEGWPGLVPLAGLVFAAGAWRRDPAAAPRLRLWLALFVATYALLAILSTGLEKFVVYGRTARALVPFACLAGGYLLHRLTTGPRWRSLAAVAALGTGALLQFSPHFFQVFPRELSVMVLGQYGTPRHWLSFSGSYYNPLTRPERAPDLALVNAQFLYPVRTYLGYPEGEVLYSTSHPLNYLPYQYEGSTPRERALLREHPPRLELIRLARPDSVPWDPPPEVLFTAGDQADGRDAGASLPP